MMTWTRLITSSPKAPQTANYRPELFMQQGSKHILRYSQTAPARTEELRHIREAVEREALNFGFDSETAFRLSLAVDEACANIIEHAYHDRSGGNFSIEIITQANMFVVTLTDSGKGFQPGPLPRLDVRKHVRAHHNGGLGLHIINLVMDAIDYAQTGEHTNMLRMVKYLNGSAQN